MVVRASPALLCFITAIGCSSESFSNLPDGSDAASDAPVESAVAVADAGTGGTGIGVDGGADATTVAPDGSFLCDELGGLPVECTLGSEVCCYVESDGPSYCVNATKSCSNAFGPAHPYACLSQSHCAQGQVCCALQDAAGSYVTSVACVSPTQCAQPHLRACTNPLECSAGTTCQPHNTRLNVCR